MSEIVSLAGDMVKTMNILINIRCSSSDVEKHIKFCAKNLKLFNQQLKALTNIREKNNLLSSIAHMKGIREN